MPNSYGRIPTPVQLLDPEEFRSDVQSSPDAAERLEIMEDAVAQLLESTQQLNALPVASASFQSGRDADDDENEADRQAEYLVQARSEFEEDLLNVVSAINIRYQTVADADLALGQLETTLNASITDVSNGVAAVEADLSNNYYTIAQTDNAISAVETNLNASITSLEGDVNVVQADLTENYYTIAQTDSAISEIETNLNASINNVSSDLSSNYYTIAQTDSAISSGTQTLRAQLDSETTDNDLVAQVNSTKTAAVDALGFAQAHAGITVQTSGGNVAGFLATSYSSPGGGGSNLLLLGDQVLVPGSITAAEINTNDFSAAGLSVFGGTLQSNNFSASQGWAIFQNGDAVFNTLFLRNGIISTAPLAQNAVSVARVGTASGPFTNNSYQTCGSVSFTPSINTYALLIQVSGLIQLSTGGASSEAGGSSTMQCDINIRIGGNNTISSRNFRNTGFTFESETQRMAYSDSAVVENPTNNDTPIEIRFRNTSSVTGGAAGSASASLRDVTLSVLEIKR